MREAQQRPQDYAGLVVRVAGYSAFFVELSKEIRMTSSAGQRISCNVVETRRDDVARIFNIQRYSLNDGEGIRTVVFFKGCPHLCPWCANPESISGKIQGPVRREAKCLHCAKCLRDADECPSGAFERIGRDISLDALEREVMKDDIFFRTSGGGVTLSGGEVLMRAKYYRFLQRLRLWGVSSPLKLPETPASLLPLAKLCDEVLFDLKIMDATQARDVVKMNLPRVLENLRLLVSEGVDAIPRLPLIPGSALSRENMQQALDVLIPLKIRRIGCTVSWVQATEILPPAGKRSMKEVPAPSSADVTTMREMAERAGFQVTVGG
ncbi:[formate-C-acetyltransferase]-activating enzyme [Escherichia coli]